MFRATLSAATVINRRSNFCQVVNRVAKQKADFGHKWGKGFMRRDAYPHPTFLALPGGGG